jgi:hypothetical protein
MSKQLLLRLLSFSFYLPRFFINRRPCELSSEAVRSCGALVGAGAICLNKLADGNCCGRLIMDHRKQTVWEQSK